MNTLQGKSLNIQIFNPENNKTTVGIFTHPDLIKLGCSTEDRHHLWFKAPFQCPADVTQADWLAGIKKAFRVDCDHEDFTGGDCRCTEQTAHVNMLDNGMVKVNLTREIRQLRVRQLTVKN